MRDIEVVLADVPGALGEFGRVLGDAGVNIWTQYSDHDGRLILVVDPLTARPPA
ncbi:hypothetical protein [Actinoplanes sp. NPDC051494]|uniref:hypothetical protein n=1 Tax=Actinoplanes sp. NPDC051494 TaxID=3363907 RepID=UPI00378ED42B